MGKESWNIDMTHHCILEKTCWHGWSDRAWDGQSPIKGNIMMMHGDDVKKICEWEILLYYDYVDFPCFNSKIIRYITTKQ